MASNLLISNNKNRGLNNIKYSHFNPLPNDTKHQAQNQSRTYEIQCNTDSLEKCKKVQRIYQDIKRLSSIMSQDKNGIHLNPLQNLNLNENLFYSNTNQVRDNSEQQARREECIANIDGYKNLNLRLSRRNAVQQPNERQQRNMKFLNQNYNSNNYDYQDKKSVVGQAKQSQQKQNPPGINQRLQQSFSHEESQKRRKLSQYLTQNKHLWKERQNDNKSKSNQYQNQYSDSESIKNSRCSSVVSIQRPNSGLKVKTLPASISNQQKTKFMTQQKQKHQPKIFKSSQKNSRNNSSISIRHLKHLSLSKICQDITYLSSNSNEKNRRMTSVSIPRQSKSKPQIMQLNFKQDHSSTLYQQQTQPTAADTQCTLLSQDRKFTNQLTNDQQQTLPHSSTFQTFSMKQMHQQNRGTKKVIDKHLNECKKSRNTQISSESTLISPLQVNPEKRLSQGKSSQLSMSGKQKLNEKENVSETNRDNNRLLKSFLAFQEAQFKAFQSLNLFSPTLEVQQNLEFKNQPPLKKHSKKEKNKQTQSQSQKQLSFVPSSQNLVNSKSFNRYELPQQTTMSNSEYSGRCSNKSSKIVDIKILSSKDQHRNHQIIAESINDLDFEVNLGNGLKHKKQSKDNHRNRDYLNINTATTPHNYQSINPEIHNFKLISKPSLSGGIDDEVMHIGLIRLSDNSGNAHQLAQNQYESNQILDYQPLSYQYLFDREGQSQDSSKITMGCETPQSDCVMKQDYLNTEISLEKAKSFIFNKKQQFLNNYL
ncbi:UNKNOWN [Stylonychia lemnae]|uniref:Uncharacterized protein n=1 Tax=Stylonychia lemnae TaxID=5949 RepID=A0A077ZPV0_STYLE|nr:UNKNOWN [Stylonychia lemnae]|eukprot:CDW71923.1 UNKNOWN [Stylonychia lemnae]